MAMMSTWTDNAQGSAGSPYTALWSAVLFTAVMDMDSRTKPESVAAHKWMWDTRSDVGSLRWICDQLDLGYEKLQLMCTTRQGRSRLVRRNWGD